MRPTCHIGTALMVPMSRRHVVGVIGAGVVGVALTACGGSVDLSKRFAAFEPADEPNGDLSKVVWPAFVIQAGGDIRRLYEFQVVSGDLMRFIPCFCGCKGDGHRNNRDCYVQAVNADGSVVFDAMAPT